MSSARELGSCRACSSSQLHLAQPPWAQPVSSARELGSCRPYSLLKKNPQILKKGLKLLQDKEDDGSLTSMFDFHQYLWQQLYDIIEEELADGLKEEMELVYGPGELVDTTEEAGASGHEPAGAREEKPPNPPNPKVPKKSPAAGEKPPEDDRT